MVDDDAVTYASDGATVRVEEGRRDGDTAVRLTRPAWNDLDGQVRPYLSAASRLAAMRRRP
ncbi:hypothetical protein [Mycobacterium talmoniae]|uniref:Uncharacterized protein n=1 Tax=Mycobacterium talmoniae TaxID=1858794 RepID=A0A1S1NM92_9MYCO|nr:hypothetical protein [Mycobacterium talmoniae]OHV05109.1 hypothetical protein BKN37_06950 [Mycobacterium talmoniae]